MKPSLIPRTFRMRLMLLSVSVSAAILLGFGGWCWRLLYSYTGLDRLDGELRGLARNQLAVPRPGGEWDAFQDALDYLGDLDPSRAFAFAVIDPRGRVEYQGAGWPPSLSPADLAASGAMPLALPPRPPGFREPGDGDPPPSGLRGYRDDRPRPAGPDDSGRLPGTVGPWGDPGGPRGPDARPARGEGLAPPPGPVPGERDGTGRSNRLGPRPRVDVVELAHFTKAGDSGAWRVTVQGNPFGALILVADLAPFHAEAHALRNTFLAVLVAALGAIGAGGWFLAQRALRPVERLVQAAEGITAQALDHRIPERGDALEFARLNRVFNAMLERLDRSFQQATRFSADAAHELKTPLTILQGQLNQLLQEAPAGSPLQQDLGRLLEEVQRLSIIIRKLLLLSLADAGRIKMNLAPVSLDRFLESIIEDVEILGPDLALTQALAPGLTVQADEALLQQAVQNLVNNAIKYNVPGGQIHVALFRQGDAARLSVANTSTGIPEADRKRVFHRFFRADPAHSRDVDGLGLGLSLAREIVRSHGGKLWLADAPEGWVMFVMELPLVKASPSVAAES